MYKWGNVPTMGIEPMATSLNWVIFFGVGFFWERNRQGDVSFFPGNTRGIATDNSYRHALCRLSYVGSGGVVAPAKLLVSEGWIEGCTFLLCVCPRFVSSSPPTQRIGILLLLESRPCVPEILPQIFVAATRGFFGRLWRVHARRPDAPLAQAFVRRGRERPRQEHAVVFGGFQPKVDARRTMMV